MCIRIEIKKTDVLRCLGHTGQELDVNLKKMIDESIAEVLEIADKRRTWRVFPLTGAIGNKKLKDTAVNLVGEDIQAHLKDAEKCALLCLTIGDAVEAKIKYHTVKNATKGLVFDACASAAAEGLANATQTEIAESAEGKGYFLTTRFSPGYGDLPLSLQPDILRTLDAHRKIGLSSTENYILQPKKSITALVGFQKKPFEKNTSNCAKCKALETCALRRRGLYCD